MRGSAHVSLVVLLAAAGALARGNGDTDLPVVEGRRHDQRPGLAASASAVRETTPNPCDARSDAVPCLHVPQCPAVAFINGFKVSAGVCASRRSLGWVFDTLLGWIPDWVLGWVLAGCLVPHQPLVCAMVTRAKEQQHSGTAVQQSVSTVVQQYSRTVVHWCPVCACNLVWQRLMALGPGADACSMFCASNCRSTPFPA